MRWEHTGTCVCACVCWIVCVCCSLKTKLIKISLELTKWPNAVTFNRRQVALDKLPNLNIYVYIYFMRTISHCCIEAEADWLFDVLPASISLLTSSQLAINLDIEKQYNMTVAYILPVYMDISICYTCALCTLILYLLRLIADNQYQRYREQCSRSSHSIYFGQVHVRSLSIRTRLTCSARGSQSRERDKCRHAMAV